MQATAGARGWVFVLNVDAVEIVIPSQTPSVKPSSEFAHRSCLELAAKQFLPALSSPSETIGNHQQVHRAKR